MNRSNDGSIVIDTSAQSVTDSAALAATAAAEYALLCSQMELACDQACQAIAPSWPLDRAIAVNPHWSRIGMPVRRVAARMAVLAGIEVFAPRESQSRAWEQGRISKRDLDLALAHTFADAVPSLNDVDCLDALYDAEPIPHLPLLIDILDKGPQRDRRLSWRQAITHQVSQTCAAYFDEHQADWQPKRSQGLYAFWRNSLQNDHGIGILMGLPELGRALDSLPSTRQAAERWVLQRLHLAPAVWADYLEAILLTVNGWASWCAYLGWNARLEGREDMHLRELLAIRLAWGVVLLECKGDAATSAAFDALRSTWDQVPMALQQAEEALMVDQVWQLALEIGYQRQLASKLTQNVSMQAMPTIQKIEYQAVFCIDVRSEPLRRALEVVCPAMQTIGFAGFFGLPVVYTPIATKARRPQMPGLLVPTMEVSERVVCAMTAPEQNNERLQHAVGQARSDHFAWTRRWLSASRWPSAAFSFVEAAGVGYLGKFRHWVYPSTQARTRDDFAGLPTRYRAICRPQLVGITVDEKVSLVGGVLHAMGLERNFAPLVLLVGHGSQSVNNAHAAALDCGACCGQTGEVNARSLAQLLNDSAVRAGLQERGIAIPEKTWFLPVLHNTTTDQIEGFDLDLVPDFAAACWEGLHAVFAQACDQVRRERAPRLGLNPTTAQDELLDQLCRRANDGAQTRPEWGLAGNAALVIAPRWRSRGLGLEGRTFLHDYDANEDLDGSVLELLMTAPMVVAHWINWQYNASICDPLRLGSGNKLLHNIVGGNIGVFEGNGGDLRIGLSRQSLHDGQNWMHEPLRLTVVIDAPREAIEKVIGKHVMLQHLIANDWLHLWQWEDTELLEYGVGCWRSLHFKGT